MIRALDLRSRGCGFDSQSAHCQVVTSWMGDCTPPSRYVTSHQGQHKLLFFFWVRKSHGSYSQGKSGNFKQLGEKSEKVREFYIPKSGKNKRVRESQGKSITRVQKLTKMPKKV